MNNEYPITIGDLYPEISEEQAAEAEATFRRYIAAMVRIYERVRNEHGREAASRLAYGDLTAPEGSVNVPNERSNPSINPLEIQ
jgi:hypothetical protein